MEVFCIEKLEVFLLNRTSFIHRKSGIQQVVRDLRSKKNGVELGQGEFRASIFETSEAREGKNGPIHDEQEEKLVHESITTRRRALDPFEEQGHRGGEKTTK